MEPRSRTLRGAHDLDLHLLEWSGTGVACLMLHGFSNDAHVWDDFAPVVAPHYRTLALDLRGHGDSAWDPEARYDYEHHVADLERVLAALGIGRFVLVGHSFGGRVAMLFAGAHPERIAGLVVVDAGPDLDARGVVRIQVDLGRQAGMDASFAGHADYERLLARAYPAARPAALARMARSSLRARADGRLVRKLDPAFHRRAAQATAEESALREKETTRRLWESLRRTTSPALVVRGAASDVLSPEVAERMVEVLPQGRLAVVAQAGHSVMTDNPEGFAEAVAAFALGDA
jgi:pimeloyl-ACP methyl ester carboxylesterase